MMPQPSGIAGTRQKQNCLCCHGQGDGLNFPIIITLTFACKLVYGFTYPGETCESLYSPRFEAVI